MIAAHGERRRMARVFRSCSARAAVLVGAFPDRPRQRTACIRGRDCHLSTAKQRFDKSTDVTVTVVIANDGATDGRYFPG